MKAIICTIGGLSSNELFPLLDWDLIGRNPKIFCGYSDITLLHCAIFSQTGLRTFYRLAAITQLAEVPKPLDFTVQHFLRVLSPNDDESGWPLGKLPRSDSWTNEFGDWENETSSESGTLKARRFVKNEGWKWLRNGKCKGRLTGGCLPSLLQLAGTKYWPYFQDKILLLENPEGERPDGPLPLDQTRSLMAHLVNLGVMDDISGLVVGRPTGYMGKELEEYEEMVLGVCGGVWRFPILAGVNVGHTDPMLTIPLNAMMILDSKGDVWEVMEAGIKK